MGRLILIVKLKLWIPTRYKSTVSNKFVNMLMSWTSVFKFLSANDTYHGKRQL